MSPLNVRKTVSVSAHWNSWNQVVCDLLAKYQIQECRLDLCVFLRKTQRHASYARKETLS